MNYDNAVKIIKTAILQSQYEAARSVNEKQLMLYYGIGKYISLNSRKGFWGKGAIDAISKRPDKELPGLKGFSARSLRYMRTFYEEWSYLDKSEPALESDNGNLAPAGAKLEISNWNQLVPKQIEFPDTSFFAIGFSHHRTILSKIKDTNQRIFYIRRCADEKYSREELIASIARDDYHHQGSLPNNFLQKLPAAEQAFRAISTFKDEHLVENAIIHNIKKFILTFGKDFAFVRNQYHLDAFGEDQYIDLLFFNRELNCLVAVELKTGKFKSSYLG